MITETAEKDVAEFFKEEKSEIPDEMKAQIDTYPEIAIWMLIDTTGRQVYEMKNHLEKFVDQKEDVPPELLTQILHCEAIQAYAASKVSDFGVQFENEIMGVQGNYWKWYEWWRNYVNSLGEDEMAAIDSAIKNGEDVSEYRPEKSWIGIVH